ncbi:hypothetical protein TCSYLVIO_004254, partial [Trypanosoma cruzi]
LATERVARSYGYRVGGVLVDYGTLYRFLVEEAEAWECSEGRLEERRKTSPLDVLAGTIAEADIDHLFVLGSAWLCFKIAQRVHARVGGSRMKPFVMHSAVVCSNGSSVHLFLVEIPIDLSITDEEELIREKPRVSEEALALHSHRSWILATDGGVDVPKSAGVGILLSSLNSSEIIEKASINCVARPCSYRTESRALLLALEKLMIPRIRHRRKTLLVVTESQSLLAALNK